MRRHAGGWKFANKVDGVFAEFFLVNQANANLAPIPDDLPDEKAVYACDMMSTGFAGAENANIPIGGTVAVSPRARWVSWPQQEPACWEPAE